MGAAAYPDHLVARDRQLLTSSGSRRAPVMSPHKSLVFALVFGLLASVTACGKQGNSAKMREMYRCWEIGWTIIEGCIASRGKDACMSMAESWFDGTKQDVTVIDNNAAFDSEKERCAKTTGYGSWNQLAADDITDEMAEALLQLPVAVRAKDVAAIRTERRTFEQMFEHGRAARCV
jgi:uncharacterized protein CbrC (UPF0167 family)